MKCCICRGVEIAKRESQHDGVSFRTINLRQFFTIPDEIKSEYSIKETIGEGNNTIVYRAENNLTKEIVAIKVIVLPTNSNENQSIKPNNLEISILKNVDDINCIHLISHYYIQQKHNNLTANVFYLVMDYFDSSLHLAFSTKRFKFINNITMIKIFAFQLFKGLSYLHNTVGIAHCDIKPSNLLFNEEDCVLKICDFGTSRVLTKNFDSSQNSKSSMNYITYSIFHPSTNNNYSDANSNINSVSNSNSEDEENDNDISVTFNNNNNNNNDVLNQPIQTTIQYRAPEILYECQNIDPAAVDIWSAGCVIAEMLRGNGKKLFSTSKSNNNATATLTASTMTTTRMPPGSSCTPIEQLTEIISILGQPNLSDFEKHEHAAIIISAKKTKSLEKMLPRNTPKDLMSLLKKILVYCPEKRPTSDECINSPFFDDIIGKDDIQMPNGKKAPKLTR